VLVETGNRAVVVYISLIANQCNERFIACRVLTVDADGVVRYAYCYTKILAGVLRISTAQAEHGQSRSGVEGSRRKPRHAVKDKAQFIYKPIIGHEEKQENDNLCKSAF
jgi:hypothetical protein